MDPLFHELLIATALVSATVVVHLVGLDLLQVTLRWHLRRLTRWVQLDRVIVPVGIVLGLFLVHAAEIWLYALVFWRVRESPSLESALVTSIETYSTLGAREGFPAGWRVVGALESINGMLLIGWSTAFLFATLRHLTWDDDGDGSLPRGAIARNRRRRKA